MLTGKKFGDLTVLENVGKRRISNVSKYDTTHYRCECACGNEIVVSEPSLVYNIVKDCGCNKFRRRFVKKG